MVDRSKIPSLHIDKNFYAAAMSIFHVKTASRSVIIFCLSLYFYMLALRGEESMNGLAFIHGSAAADVLAALAAIGP